MKPYSSKLNRVFAAAVVATIAIVNAAAGQRSEKGRSDFALYNPAKGVWYTTSADDCAFVATRWGQATDRLVPADYDGDGELDNAVWRAENGTWYIKRSSDSKAQIVRINSTSGVSDEPIPADFDGDGKADIAVFRATSGEWIVLESSKGFVQSKSEVRVLGRFGDIPVAADYDGDRKADLAVFRGSENRWYIQQSSDGKTRVETFGKAGQDVLVPADYTGDGKADLTVYRSGTWYVLSSETGETEPFVFGFSDDIAAPGDYDGDGTTDFAVFRKGTWYIYDSGKPKFRTFDFGTENDIPLNSLSTRKSFSP